MRRQIRILVISYLPPVSGGISTWTGILRDRAVDARFRFRFLNLPTSGSLGRPDPLRHSLKTLRFLARLTSHLALDRPDVVHLNSCLSPLGVWRDLVVALAARAARLPVVAHYRGSLPHVFPRLPAASRLALQALIRISSVNVALTHASRALLRQVDPAKHAIYLPNLVEEDLMRRPRAQGEIARTSAKRARAIYVGRLSEDKGTPELLRAARTLPDTDFELVGEVLPEMLEPLKAAPSNVVVTGPLSRAEVLEKLLGSDLFVFPSRREGFPNAVLEAMAAGLPVAATRVGAVTDMIEHGRGGLLADPGDVDGLTDGIRHLVDDPALAILMGEHNRVVCSRRFAAPAGFAPLYAVYDGVSKSSPHGRREDAPPGSVAFVSRREGADP